MSLAGWLRWRGVEPDEVERTLVAYNREHCVPPLGEREVRRIARSIARYES